MLEKFIERCDSKGWDDAICWLKYNLGEVHPQMRETLSLLTEVYDLGYLTPDYNEYKDPDRGVCYNIREFAITEITKYLENGEFIYG